MKRILGPPVIVSRVVARARLLQMVFALVMAAVLLSVYPMTALADDDPTFTAAITRLTNVSPGEITVKAHRDGSLKVRTRGERNTAILNCGADPICNALGLAGVDETHNSKVELTPTGPGAFSLNGELNGRLNILNASGAVIAKGKLEATISGTASCVPVGLNPCGTFAISVTDVGEWKVKPPKSEGTITLAVGGVVGVFLTGGGVLSGSLKD